MSSKIVKILVAFLLILAGLTVPWSTAYVFSQPTTSTTTISTTLSTITFSTTTSFTTNVTLTGPQSATSQNGIGLVWIFAVAIIAFVVGVVAGVLVMRCRKPKTALG